ncbi:hypothetical protein [Candidatus Poriferisodalis sp.]|uniref:hypothetical protein n=1 Tax=Candidatus Poriferisodalis sp. TaxID=3101277 RepID=UPI003AF817BB
MTQERRRLAAAALCAGVMLTGGCSSVDASDSPSRVTVGPATAPAATASPAAPAALTTTQGMTVAETPQRAAASGTSSAADAAAGLRVARSDPFWIGNLHTRFDPGRLADLADLRVLPAKGEPLGPLRDGPRRDLLPAAELVLNRVFDMCDTEDLLAEARLDGPHVAPTLLFREFIPMMVQQRGLMGCGDPDPEPGEYEPRWALWGSGGAVRWYDTPEQARDAIARRETAAEERLAHSLPRGENAPGIDKLFTSDVVLLVPDQAADELRVESGTVSVIDGVVRGLVRNRSRELWAYGVSVTIGNGTWHWPLSIQPGEIAPFEIEGWTGEQPDPTQFSIKAEFSPEIDISRAWFAASSPGVRRLTPAWLRSDGYPAELYESLPDEEVVMLHGFARAQYEFPQLMIQKISHPSLAEVAHFVTVPDLRGYAALVPAGELGPIVDVVRIPLYAHYYFPGFDQARYIETSRYPFPRVENARRWSSFKVNWAFHLPGRTQARVWVGGAHPPNHED